MEDKGKVVVGYCSPGQVYSRFHESFVNLLNYDLITTRRIWNDGSGRIPFEASANISTARNAMCRLMLETAADWLWMVDTDMTFPPDLLERLMANADPDKAPIVGGLCFGVEDGRLFPTMYDLGGTEEKPEFIRYDAWPEGMFQVFATGAACLLIHRTALERIRDYEHPDRPGEKGFSAVYPWFQEREFGQTPMGEDMTFCFRAGLAGLPVHVDTTVRLGHVKRHTLSVEGYLSQRALLMQQEYLAEVAK